MDIENPLPILAVYEAAERLACAYICHSVHHPIDHLIAISHGRMGQVSARLETGDVQKRPRRNVSDTSMRQASRFAPLPMWRATAPTSPSFGRFLPMCYDCASSGASM